MDLIRALIEGTWEWVILHSIESFAVLVGLFAIILILDFEREYRGRR